MSNAYDRLRPAAYTAPNGDRMGFEFEDVTKTISKKTTAHDFPDTNVTYVEDRGMRGRRYPMRVIFSGDDHDIAADRFENLLTQKGPGKLEHPAYGEAQIAIPFGDIVRTTALVTAGNQTTFDITFYATVEDVYPSDVGDTSAAISVAIASTAFAVQFSASVDISRPSAKAGFLATMKAIVNGAKAGLQKAVDGTAALTAGMDRVNTALNNALTTGIGTPLSLAAQLKSLALAPARSAALLRDRLAAYKALATSIFRGQGTGTGGGTGSSDDGAGVLVPGLVAPGIGAAAANTFHANALTAQYMILGQASAAAQPVEGQAYASRDEVVEVLDGLLELFGDYTAWADANFAALTAATPAIDPFDPVATGPGSLDTGGAQAQLKAVVSATVAVLMSTAALLPPRRVFVTPRDATPLDLCARLYGGLDDLDDFIAANDFTADQLLFIPAGTPVVYFA